MRHAAALSPRRPWFLLVTLLAALSAGGCGEDGGGDAAERPTSPAPRQTVILGIDALDYQVLDPVIAAGEAPTLQRLRERGASGIHLSFVPLEKSPLIWASMASGLEPQDHGVGGFVRGREGEYDVLASAADWRAPALWDIAGAAGLRSCIIGWWVTYPARAIDGVLVADHHTYTPAGTRNPEGMVRPASLTEELAALTVDWREIPVALLQELLPQADPQLLADPQFEPLRKLRACLAGDLTYLATAKALARRETYDLFAVYFRGLDVVCHEYWRYWDAGDGPPASEQEQRLYGQIVPRYVALVDRWLAELLPLLPSQANVVVASDHGFYGPRRDRQGTLVKGVSEHRPEGVLILRSPLYAPKSRFDRSFVLNFAPTVLALLGLPASQEMPGRILREGLSEAGRPYVAQLEQHRLGSYAGLAPAPPPEVASDPAVDEAVKKQLRSLGYVD